MNQIRFLKIWSLAVGSMDAVTGMLLIFAPAAVLGMLGIALPSPDALVYLNWMGVFICGVGLSYGLAFVSCSGGETVWIFTALIRMMVAVFLAVKIFSGALVPAWGIVGISDALVAGVQIAVLRAGWWKGTRS